jgi:hypothetical protein
MIPCLNPGATPESVGWTSDSEVHQTPCYCPEFARAICGDKYTIPGTPKLKKLVEAWVEAHETELLQQWNNARNHIPMQIVG